MQIEQTPANQAISCPKASQRPLNPRDTQTTLPLICTPSRLGGINGGGNPQAGSWDSPRERRSRVIGRKFEEPDPDPVSVPSIMSTELWLQGRGMPLALPRVPDRVCAFDVYLCPLKSNSVCPSPLRTGSAHLCHRSRGLNIMRIWGAGCSGGWSYPS